MPSRYKSKVYFFFSGVTVTLRNRQALKKHISEIFKREKKNLDSLNYIFCSDKALLTINRQYLKHNFYTDILTFDISENEEKIVGEIYISTDRVRDNAQKLGVSFRSELIRVIFHGALHLCGYKDKSKRDKASMRTREDYYLTQFTN